MALTECQAPGVCDQERFCSVKPNWLVINRTVRDALSNVTLADMTRPIGPRLSDLALPRRRSRDDASEESASHEQPDRFLDELSRQEYPHGFVTAIESDVIPAGLSEEVVRLISRKRRGSLSGFSSGASRPTGTG